GLQAAILENRSPSDQRFSWQRDTVDQDRRSQLRGGAEMRAELGIFRRVQAAVLVAVAGAFATVDLGMQHAHAESVVPLRGASERVRLGLSKSLVVDLPADAFDILVSNPRIADAITRTSRRIYLFGKQVGETNIFVF